MGVEILRNGVGVVSGKLTEQPGDRFGDQDALFPAKPVDDLEG